MGSELARRQLPDGGSDEALRRVRACEGAGQRAPRLQGEAGGLQGHVSLLPSTLWNSQAAAARGPQPPRSAPPELRSPPTARAPGGGFSEGLGQPGPERLEPNCPETAEAALSEDRLTGTRGDSLFLGHRLPCGHGWSHLGTRMMADVPRHQGRPWSSWDPQRDSSPPGPLKTQPCLSADDKATGEWVELGSGQSKAPIPPARRSPGMPGLGFLICKLG